MGGWQISTNTFLGGCVTVVAAIGFAATGVAPTTEMALLAVVGIALIVFGAWLGKRGW